MICYCCCCKFLIIRIHKRPSRSKKLKQMYKRRDELKKELEKLEGKKKVSFKP